MTTKVSDVMLVSGGGGGSPPETAGVVPIGAAVEYWGTVAPANWAFAVGQAVSRTTYAALFAAYGTQFGAGDGSTTFNLPDKRGRVSLGRDNMGGTPANRVTSAVSGITATTLGATGGDQRLQAHNHLAAVTDPGHVHSVGARVNDTPNTNIAAGAGTTTGAETTTTSTTGITVDIADAGTGGSQNMPPVIVCNYIIRLL